MAPAASAARKAIVSADDTTSTASPSSANASADEANTGSEIGEEINCISKKLNAAERCMPQKRAAKISKGQERAVLAMQQELRFAAVWAEQVLAEATVRDAELQAARSELQQCKESRSEKAADASDVSAKIAVLQMELATCQNQVAKEQVANSSARTAARSQQLAQAAELRDLKEQLSSTRKELQDCKAFSDNQQQNSKKELQAATEECRTQGEQLKSLRKELQSCKRNSEVQQKSLKKELQAVTSKLQDCHAQLDELPVSPKSQSQKVTEANEGCPAPSNASPAKSNVTSSLQSDVRAQKGRRIPGHRELEREAAAQRLGDIRKARSRTGYLPAVTAAVAIQALLLILWYAS